MQSNGRYFWKVTGWSSRNQPSGTSFGIWVSPEFVKTAKAIEVTPEMEGNFQRSAAFIIEEAGWSQSAMGPERWAQFGEYGLMHFSVPGSATGLDWDMANEDVEEHGATFTPHNVDSFMQQSALMSIWLQWANFVEIES